jgi:hypothetical protein
MGGRTATLEGPLFLLPLSRIKKKRDIFLYVPGFVASEEPDYSCLIESTPYSNVTIIEQQFVYYSGVTC